MPVTNGTYGFSGRMLKSGTVQWVRCVRDSHEKVVVLIRTNVVCVGMTGRRPEMCLRKERNESEV